VGQDGAGLAMSTATMTQAWHEQRALGIGGSECAALFNEGYGCHKRLIMEKRGIVSDYQRPAREEAILERGNELEDIIADKFARESGLKIRRQSSRVSSTHPHARVNMDRQIVAADPFNLKDLTGFPVDNFNTPGVLECKSMNEWDYKKLLNEGMDKHPHYILQIQHAMAVTGYKWGIFAVLEPTWFQFMWFPVLRHESLCAEILKRVETSWGLVEDTTLPLPDALPAGDKRCRNCLYRKSCRGQEYLEQFAGSDFKHEDYTEITDDDFQELVYDYIAANDAADRAAEVKSAIQERIKEELTKRSVSQAIVPGVLKFNWKEQKGRSTWDGKAIEGEINGLRKSADQQLVQIALRIENCKKVSAPSRPFKTFNV
jgi:predicted phage-related endonuclease